MYTTEKQDPKPGAAGLIWLGLFGFACYCFWGQGRSFEEISFYRNLTFYLVAGLWGCCQMVNQDESLPEGDGWRQPSMVAILIALFLVSAVAIASNPWGAFVSAGLLFAMLCLAMFLYIAIRANGHDASGKLQPGAALALDAAMVGVSLGILSQALWSAGQSLPVRDAGVLTGWTWLRLRVALTDDAARQMTVGFAASYAIMAMLIATLTRALDFRLDEDVRHVMHALGKVGSVVGLCAVLCAGWAGVARSRAETPVGEGDVHLRGGDFESAQADYQRALAYCPTFIPAAAGLARLALRRSDIKNAGRWYALEKEAMGRLDGQAVLAPADDLAADQALDAAVAASPSKGNLESAAKPR